MATGLTQIGLHPLVDPAGIIVILKELDPEQPSVMTSARFAGLKRSTEFLVQRSQQLHERL